jgi:hypothetical protein
MTKEEFLDKHFARHKDALIAKETEDGYLLIRNLVGLGWDARNEEIEKLQQENKNLKWEYDNVCKFANDFESQRDSLLEWIKRAKVAERLTTDLKEELSEAIRLLLFYEPILRKFGCSPYGDHDDPSWCTAECNDYGKKIRKFLEKFDKKKEE